MQKVKVFGCNDYYSGGKIIAIISLVENFIKVVLSVIFLWWPRANKNGNVERGIRHAETYTGLGLIGMALSIILICGISRKAYKMFIPWICFQIVIIAYPIYFAIELARCNGTEMFDSSEACPFQAQFSWVYLPIFVFHTIFEGYYLCLIIGLSQIVANLAPEENEAPEISKKCGLKYLPYAESV